MENEADMQAQTGEVMAPPAGVYVGEGIPPVPNKMAGNFTWWEVRREEEAEKKTPARRS